MDGFSAVQSHNSRAIQRLCGPAVNTFLCNVKELDFRTSISNYKARASSVENKSFLSFNFLMGLTSILIIHHKAS